MEASPKDWRAVSSLYIQSCRAFLTRSRWKAPSIWLVTGVHLISDGRVHAGWDAGLNMQGGISADAGTLAGGPPTGKPAADVQGSLKKHIHMEEPIWPIWRARLVCAIHGACCRLHKRATEKRIAGLVHKTAPQERGRSVATPSGQSRISCCLRHCLFRDILPLQLLQAPDPIFFPPTSGNFRLTDDP